MGAQVDAARQELRDANVIGAGLELSNQDKKEQIMKLELENKRATEDAVRWGNQYREVKAKLDSTEKGLVAETMRAAAATEAATANQVGYGRVWYGMVCFATAWYGHTLTHTTPPPHTASQQLI